MKKVGFLFGIFIVLNCWSPVDASVLYQVNGESYSDNQELPNPPFCMFDCGAGDGTVGTAQSSSECDSATSAPSGNICFRWDIAENQDSHYNEIKDTGGINYVLTEGEVIWLAWQQNFNRISGNDIWHDAGDTNEGFNSADKGVELKGDDISDFRWVVSQGQWSSFSTRNQDHHWTVWAGNPNNHFNPSVEVGDIFLQNVFPYSQSNPIQLDYERWYNFVLEVKFADTSPKNGYVKVYINGIKIIEYTGLQTANTFSGSNIVLDLIEIGGTIAQGDYDTPAHTRFFDNFVIATSASDVSSFMSDPNPTTTAAVISNNTTGSPVGDFTGTQDTHLREQNTTANYATSSTFEATKWDAGDHSHALLKFSGLSNIPATATVTSVTVGLWLDGDNGGTHTIDLRRALRGWVENQATWNIYSSGNNWATSGGLSAGNDRVSTVSGSIVGVGSTQQYYTVTQTSGGLVNDVQGWIDGTLTNNGWHLERSGTGNDNTYKYFGAADGDNGHRPYLSVTYFTPPTTTVVISNNTTGTPVGTVGGTEDTWLQQDNPTTNRGASSLIDISKYGSGSHGHGLLKFSGLSNLPSNAIITSITLGLWLETDGGGTHTIDLRRELRSWVEAQATWNIYSTGNNWTTGGSLSAGNDRVSTISGSFTGVGSTLQYYTITQTSGVLLDDVQGWIDGTLTNNGWHLERNGAGEDGTYKDFTSKDGTNGHRPYLSVTYYLD